MQLKTILEVVELAAESNVYSRGFTLSARSPEAIRFHTSIPVRSRPIAASILLSGLKTRLMTSRPRVPRLLTGLISFILLVKVADGLGQSRISPSLSAVTSHL